MKYGLQFLGPSPTFYSGFRTDPYGLARFDSSNLNIAFNFAKEKTTPSLMAALTSMYEK
ncbi:hypothetical protein MTR_5g004670 [Medicago truncatula]|uniref:Uncharacterized protein n=1 Tax=Medicago truncatula TaxID=3880 RepID=G7ZVC2_MEDTR|nr:hypothetical protein MTR_5g004670 [Medicago truncatula]